MLKSLKKMNLSSFITTMCSKRMSSHQKWVYAEKSQLFNVEFVNAFENVQTESRCPFVVLDVRTDPEITLADIPSTNKKGVAIPKYNIELQYLLKDPNSYYTLPKDKYVICMCHHGIRSSTAAFHLKNRGYKALNLFGGIDGLSQIWDDI